VNSQKTIVDISAAVSIKVAKQPKYLMWIRLCLICFHFVTS
jgi:hypothetical protein